jgi:hypothetical protein
VNSTTFENQCLILAELWVSRRKDPIFTEFVEYNDMGLPLAYGVAEEFVHVNDIVKGFIEETFSLLLTGLGIEEDTGFYVLDELLS